MTNDIQTMPFVPNGTFFLQFLMVNGQQPFPNPYDLSA